ncbi:MAG TPA: hypothetical protein VNZ58_13325 [Thermomicrobiales bacterium]|nr:hypothetical protein [Thermomicrobiales bacterium]
MSQQRRTAAEKDRIRQSRQVLAGNAVRPSPDPWAMSDSAIPFTPLQRNYVIALIVLLLIGAGLAIVMDSMLLASIPFFILALGLIAARFVF